MNNLIARQRFELYAQSYANFSFYPPNNLANTLTERQHIIETQQKTIEKLSKAGII